jgi:glutamyl endopeptidase
MAQKPRRSVSRTERSSTGGLSAQQRKGLVFLTEPPAPEPQVDLQPVDAHRVPPSKYLLLGRMAETNGGSALENVPRFNAARARVANLLPRRADFRLEAQPGSDDFAPENIIGDNDLVYLSDVTGIPWRSIAMLTIEYQSGAQAFGTAWFVGPRALVTAGHNIYDRRQGRGRAERIFVSPGFSGSTDSFGTYPAVQFWCESAWSDHSRQPAPDELDYGVLLISDPSVGQRLGTFGVAAYSDSQLLGMQLSVSGYPAERNFSRAQHYNGGRIKRVIDKFLIYGFDTLGGMSGAPIFAKFGEQRIAVGIHTSGNDLENRARRIDPALQQVIAHFAAQ